MSIVTLPRAGVTPIGYLDASTGKVFLDPDWARGFDQLVRRTGGVTATATTMDLSVSAFEGGRIPEQQAQLQALEQARLQEPRFVETPLANDVPSTAELQARVDALETAIRALQQGAQA
jgi:hypothetical protein